MIRIIFYDLKQRLRNSGKKRYNKSHKIIHIASTEMQYEYNLEKKRQLLHVEKKAILENL